MDGETRALTAAKNNESLPWLSCAEKLTEHITDSESLRDGAAAALARTRPAPRLGGRPLCGTRSVAGSEEPARAEGRRREARSLETICEGESLRNASTRWNTIRHFEALARRYEGLGGVALPEDQKVTVLIEVCSHELRDYMELKNKDIDSKSAREEIMNLAERKRETATSQANALEFDEVHSAYWGEEQYGYRSCEDDVDGVRGALQVLVHAVMPYSGYAKGKGPAKGQAKGLLPTLAVVVRPRVGRTTTARVGSSSSAARGRRRATGRGSRERASWVGGWVRVGVCLGSGGGIPRAVAPALRGGRLQEVSTPRRRGRRSRGGGG